MFITKFLLLRHAVKTLTMNMSLRKDSPGRMLIKEGDYVYSKSNDIGKVFMKSILLPRLNKVYFCMAYSG